MPLYTRQATASFFEVNPPVVSTQTITYSGSTQLLMPFEVPNNVSGAYIRMLANIPAMTSTTMSTGGASGTGGKGIYVSYNMVLLSRGTGANSLSLQYVTSSSGGTTASVSYSIAANGTQMSSTYGISFDQAGSATNTTFGVSESTNSYRLYSTMASQFSGSRFMDYPFAYSLSPGQYWIALAQSSSTTTSGATTVDITNWSYPAAAAISLHMVPQVNVAYLIQGSTSNSSMQLQPGLGSWTTNAVNATTSSYQLAAISTSASNIAPYFQIGRTA